MLAVLQENQVIDLCDSDAEDAQPQPKRSCNAHRGSTAPAPAVASTSGREQPQCR